jgi:hypothetical protein
LSPTSEPRRVPARAGSLRMRCTGVQPGLRNRITNRSVLPRMAGSAMFKL